VNEHDTSLGESLEEDTRALNGNLVRLIEAVGGLLSASTDVLARVQGILGGQPATDMAGDIADSETPGVAPPPADPKA
jgi:hypothetical protein